MDIEEIVIDKTKNKSLTEEQLSILKVELLKNEFEKIIDFIKYIQKTYKFNCSKIDLIKIYNSLGYEDYNLKKKLIKKIQKSQSGIISVTVLTSGTPEYTNKNGERVKGTFS